MSRLDVILCQKNLVPSRSKATEIIKAGCVLVNGVVVTKPSFLVEEDALFEVKTNLLKYVSRGGLKLEKAINEFGLDFNQSVVLDMGASTGGFTDCALQNGASRVYSVDVGSGQLAEKLKNDNRVINIENTDVRTLDKEIFDKCSYIVADISFVSEIKILSSILDKISNQKLIILVKPQFECGIEIAKKYKGLIKDYKLSKKIADEAIEKIKNLGFKIIKTTDSPITGGDGNNEFIIFIEKIKA